MAVDPATLAGHKAEVLYVARTFYAAGEVYKNTKGDAAVEALLSGADALWAAEKVVVDDKVAAAQAALEAAEVVRKRFVDEKEAYLKVKLAMFGYVAPEASVVAEPAVPAPVPGPAVAAESAGTVAAGGA